MTATVDTLDVIARARTVANGAMDARAGGQALRWVAWMLALGALVAMSRDLGFTSERLLSGLHRAGHLLTLMWPPTSAGQAGTVLKALGQTVAMALLGSTLVMLFALPLGVLGARTIVRQPIVHFLLRRSFDIGRAVPMLVWAMVLIAAFGLGPRVGVTAMVLAETPRLAKLFAETMENRNRGVIESLQAAGASPLQVLRYGLVPQVLPLIVGKALQLFETNIRASAALGLVGAGGIGVLLDTRIALLQLDQVSWILMLFIILVMTIDLTSQAIRRRLINAKSHSLIGMEADA